MRPNRSDDFKIINIRQLAQASGVPYHKLRDCIVGVYESLTPVEQTKVYNAMREHVERSAAFLGFSFDGKPIRKKG